MNIARILSTNVRLCPGRITTSAHNLYKNQVQCCCVDNSRRQFSLQSSVESVAKTQSGIFKSISESTPVEYAQKLLLNIHETTGLPWWATIVSTTILMRATITFPLAIYQNYILAKVENLSLEMPAIAKELKKEIGVAVRLYKWDEKMAKMQYKLTLKKEWNKLIVRDNCHPVKSSLLLWFQIPMWVSFSVSLRNLVYELPNQDFSSKMTLTELSVGGFGWIPNLVEVDSSLILPVTLGLINLAIIEIQTLSKVNVPSKLQRYATNFFRGFSVLMIPIAASVPSCMALYWTTSSAFGLVQNMILMSPKVKKSFKIPLTASQLEKPYAHLLAFCVGSKTTINHYHETMSDALQGVELEFSGLDIEYKSDIQKTVYCGVQLNEEKYKAFVYAVKNHYWYQMYIDDLPIWGIVGEVTDSNYYIWTHKKFEMGYNEDQIVDVNITSEDKVLLTPSTKLTFTYEVTWRRSNIKFKDRFDKYLDPSFFQHRIHWFSIFNSFMMVIFLVGLVSMILMRTLRKDYARYSKDDDIDDMERDLGDEYGWKQVHGDVFRPASHSLLFSSLIGAGHQLTTVVFSVITFAILGELYTERGSLLSTAIFVYAVTSPLNGFFGGSLYARMGGKLWIRQMLVSAFLLPALVCGTAFLINFIAIYYHASRAIPFGTMVAVTCICLFVILPLTLVGTVLGRNLSGQPDHPCRVNAVPRPIPEKKWFMEPGVIILLGGVLPFASIFIEMYFIFTSFWAYKIYYVYGFMLLVFLILLIVVVCVTIVCAYFLLNAEDYRWQWTSFLCAASTALYVYFYAVYYFFFKTKMYGLFQTAFYFGYMALFSGGLAVICGTVGYIGTSMFVKKIYSTVKID